MDYTIIGAEANLTARLQAIAEPGSIVVSFETYALAFLAAHLRQRNQPGDRAVRVEGLAAASERAAPVFNGHAPGLDLFLDINTMYDGSAERVRGLLGKALAALDERGAPEPAGSAHGP
jgi:hypothetical protein